MKRTRIAAAAVTALMLAACLSQTALADETYRGYLEAPAGMVDVGIPTQAKAASAMTVLSYPMSILETGDGKYLVTDTGNNVIWSFAGGTDSIIAGNAVLEDIFRQAVGGYNDAASRDSLFEKPWGIAPYRGGYAVSDSGNNVIRFIDTAGGVTRTAGSVASGFSRPTGLAADNDGNLYISDTLNNRICRMDTAGNVSTYIYGVTEPTGLYWTDGSLYVAEAGAGRILKCTNGTKQVITEGLDNHQAVTVAPDGVIYISDTGNHRVLKRTGEDVSVLLQGDPAVLGELPVSPCGLLVSGDKLMICDNFLQQLIVIGR